MNMMIFYIVISDGPVAMSYARMRADAFGLAQAYENKVGSNCNRILKQGKQ